mmetsp:Transcript_41160/g.71133  ORF Transcript_41160/g.71133 Transcript_41160/m.71133 type:complete len:118 (+) Transcript_41160:264-617(+)
MPLLPTLCTKARGRIPFQVFWARLQGSCPSTTVPSSSSWLESQATEAVPCDPQHESTNILGVWCSSFVATFDAISRGMQPQYVDSDALYFEIFCERPMCTDDWLQISIHEKTDTISL